MKGGTVVGACAGVACVLQIKSFKIIRVIDTFKLTWYWRY